MTFNVKKSSSTKVAFRRRSSTRGSSHSQLGWVMPEPAPETEHYESIASLTPREFVKRDKQKKLRERNMKNCFDSLTTLYDNVLVRKYSENTLQNHLELAKESTQCAKICSQHTMNTLPCDAMTQSLFNLLEKIVIPSSTSAHLPFDGDFTTLVLDAGNLPRECPNSKIDLLKKTSSMTMSAVSDTAINIFSHSI